jgi:hypothetical protein
VYAVKPKGEPIAMKLEKNITPEVVVVTPAKKIVTPAKFESVTLTFTSEQEYCDVVAALTAYGRKITNVEGSSIAKDKGLKCSKDVRKTINALLARLP